MVLGTFLEHLFKKSTLFCADGQSFAAFFFLHPNMIFEYPRDSLICDVINNLFSIVDVDSHKHLYSIMLLFSIKRSSFYQYVFPNLNNVASTGWRLTLFYWVYNNKGVYWLFYTQTNSTQIHIYQSLKYMKVNIRIHKWRCTHVCFTELRD